MTQTEATEAYQPTTIVDSSFTTSAGYVVRTQLARCRPCYGRIERVIPNSGPAGIWGHMDTGRSACILPADGDTQATPL